MYIKELVNISEMIASTASKKEKAELIAHTLLKPRGRELEVVVHYLAGELPQGRIGIGIRTLKEGLSQTEARESMLTVMEVDHAMEAISATRGPGSYERTRVLLANLMARATPRERDFIARLILGEVRQGALEGMVLEGIAGASSVSLGLLRQAHMLCGSLGKVARIAMEEGIQGLSRLRPTLFRPIAPMLANSVNDSEEALDKLGEAGWEFKVDGARIQVHKEGKDIKIFSRHLRDVTKSLPEIETVVKGLPVREVILEGEVIAVDDKGRPLPFQTTMRRFGRLKDIEGKRQSIPITTYFFDCLLVEGDGLLNTPYRERFRVVEEYIPSRLRIPRIVTGLREKVEEFLNRSLREGHEGLMAKRLDSPYIAGQRGSHWLKLKPAITLDLVVLAAEWGHGRRRGWLSNLHLGARDPSTGGFVMLGKTFKGLTDEMLRWQTKRLLQLAISKDDEIVYVRPELVVEVAFNEIQASPRYPAGLALRFARVKRFREDKGPHEADTIERVKALFCGGRGDESRG